MRNRTKGTPVHTKPPCAYLAVTWIVQGVWLEVVGVGFVQGWVQESESCYYSRTQECQPGTSTPLHG